MTSGSGLQVKGALIRARLQFISDRFGSAAKRRAEMAIGERSDISHGILLASYWYPMAVSQSLERAIEGMIVDRGDFSWQEVGSYEARLLLKGSHAAMVKPTPEAMADRVPLIFSSLYQGFGVRTRQVEPSTFAFDFNGIDYVPKFCEIHKGFLTEILSTAGAAGCVAENGQLSSPSQWTISCRWESFESRCRAEIIRVDGEGRIVDCRDAVRRICREMGFGNLESVALMTCVSELARNIVNYVGEGTIRVEEADEKGRRCIRIRSVDKGPGISNLEEIMAGRHRSTHGLGRGLIAVKQLGDEFKVDSTPGRGTTVEVVKYLGRH